MLSVCGKKEIKFEMCHKPASIFNSTGCPRKKVGCILLLQWVNGYFFLGHPSWLPVGTIQIHQKLFHIILTDFFGVHKILDHLLKKYFLIVG